MSVDVKPLSHYLSSLETGKRPRGGAVDSGVPSLGGEHINANGTLKLEPMKYVPEDFYSGLRKGLIQPNDVLVVKDGATTGRIGFVDDSFPFERAAINEHVFIIRPDLAKAEPLYIYFLLRSQTGNAQIMSDFRGAAQGGISREFADKVYIPDSPLPEQRRIVDILSRAESIVRLRREAEKKTAELIPALFLDMFGDPATNPKGWPIKLLGDLAVNEKYAIKAGPFGSALKKEMYVQEGYKIYGQEQVIRDDLAYGDYYIDESKYRELENCRVQAQDLLISLVGTFGKISIVPEVFEPGIINPRLMKITLDRSQVLPGFIKALLTGSVMRSRIEERSHGGTMNIVNVGIMKSLEIIVPPLALQTKFCLHVDSLIAIQTQQSAATAKAQATFDALLAQVFA